MKPTFTNLTDLWDKVEGQKQAERNVTVLSNLERRVCENLCKITGQGTKKEIREIFKDNEYALDVVKEQFPDYYLSMFIIVYCDVRITDLVTGKNTFKNTDDPHFPPLCERMTACGTDGGVVLIFDVPEFGLWTASSDYYQTTPTIITNFNNQSWYFTPLDKLIKRWQEIGKST